MRMELRDYNNGYLYRCKVTDGNGNVLISEPVALVCVPIHITQQPVDFYGAVGDRVEFTIAADGTDLTYQWQVSANNGKTWTNSTVGGYATASMWVTLSTSNPGKQYRCKVTDGSGNVVYSEPGTIRTDLVAVTKQPEDCTAAYGERLSFTIEAYGENLSYQWQVSSNNGSTWSNTSAGGNKTASMWLTMSTSYPGYLYRCQVTDGSGNVVYSEPARAKAAQVTWKYTYDADGMRTSRTNQETTYKYYYVDGQLVRMKVNSTTMLFSYGADGSPMSVYYSGANYYYVTNVQGDVVAILNESGSEVVSYTYDAWGKLLSTTGSHADNLGKLNPLRYRGYVYDEEYGFYYLQSRYYNPEIGRFLNADAFATTGQGLLGNNMFAYCLNNPVIYCDKTGCLVIEASALAVILVIAEYAMVVVAASLMATLVIELVDTVVEYYQTSIPANATVSLINEGDTVGSQTEIDVTVNTTSQLSTPNNNDDDEDDYYNDDSNFGGREKIGKSRGGTPGNNKAQNKQFKDATKGLSKWKQREIHDLITKKQFGYEDIVEIAEWYR